jgi:hypothetical protein
MQVWAAMEYLLRYFFIKMDDGVGKSSFNTAAIYGYTRPSLQKGHHN